MTSVRDAALPAQPHATPRPAKRPKCRLCGKPLPSVTGGRPKIYCSDACRKRADRILAKGQKRPESVTGSTRNVAGQAASSAPKTGGRFSSNAKTPSTPGQSGCEGETDPKRTPAPSGGRDGRFERRDRHQTVALSKRFRDCGLRLATGDAKVMLAAAGSIAGVKLCTNVNVCPWCMAKVLAIRASNIQAAADGLTEKGYGLALGTHTLRHFERLAYGSLRKDQRGGLVAVLHDGWKGAFGSAGRPWRRLRDKWGIVGYERAFEDTWGSESGFHLHWHVLWVFERQLTQAECLEFQREVAEMWRDAVVAAGGYAPSLKCDRPNCPCEGEGHGTDVRIIGGTEEGETARYLYKDGDKNTANIGMEMARPDFKDGRTWGRMSPLQLGDLAAEELAALGEPGPLTAKYRERERGVHAVRKHFRTPTLNKLIKALGIPQDTRTEAEITGDEGEGPRLLAVIPPRTWYRHIAYQNGRRLALIRAAEALGEIGVQTLIESWGLVWGRDVLPAPIEPDATPAEEVPAPNRERRIESAVHEAKQATAMTDQERAAEEFRAARRASNATRADEIAASMARIRGTA